MCHVIRLIRSLDHRGFLYTVFVRQWLWYPFLPWLPCHHCLAMCSNYSISGFLRLQCGSTAIVCPTLVYVLKLLYISIRLRDCLSRLMTHSPYCLIIVVQCQQYFSPFWLFSLIYRFHFHVFPYRRSTVLWFNSSFQQTLHPQTRRTHIDQTPIA